MPDITTQFDWYRQRKNPHIFLPPKIDDKFTWITLTQRHEIHNPTKWNLHTVNSRSIYLINNEKFFLNKNLTGDKEIPSQTKCQFWKLISNTFDCLSSYSTNHLFRTCTHCDWQCCHRRNVYKIWNSIENAIELHSSCSCIIVFFYQFWDVRHNGKIWLCVLRSKIKPSKTRVFIHAIDFNEKFPFNFGLI